MSGDGAHGDPGEAGSGEAGEADVSRLERRYRSLLRVLPRWYRVEREEEMVGIFLADRGDGLDQEYGWPGWGEAAATAGLAVRVRLGAGRAAGSVVRLLGLAGLLGQLVPAAQSWSAAVWSGAFGPGAAGVGGVPPWAWWADVVVLVAFACLVAGRRAAGRVVAGVAAVLASSPVLVEWVRAPAAVSWWPLVFAGPAWVAGAAVVAGFHAEAPPVSRRWWVAGAAGVLSGAVSGLLVPLSPVSVLAAWVVTAGAVVASRPWAGVSGAVPGR